MNRKVKLDDRLAHAVPHQYSDEGIRERNARPTVRAGVGRVRVDESFDQQLERMKSEVVMGDDPHTEVMSLHREAHPEMAFRMLSERVVTRRGKRGWQPVVDQKGDPIRSGGMILATMPREIAEAVSESRREEGNANLRHSQEKLAEEQERLIRDARVGGFSPLRRNEIVTDNEDPDVSIPVGINRARGEQPAAD